MAVGVLDTNAVILLERFASESLPDEPVITAVTLAELSVGPLVATTRKERVARQARLQEAEAAFDPLPFDAAAARAFGGVAASLRGSGRKTSARAFDALIAATAIANGLPLYSANPRDYAGIEGLDLVAIDHT
jgi:tRNA(fMet)-specific endonuclease VapC